MTSISKNVYIEKLNDIVNKYNNTYHGTIKMKPVAVKDNTYNDSKSCAQCNCTLVKKLKMLNLKLVIM